MEASSPQETASQMPLPLPEGVSDADLYDGPKIVPLASGKIAFVQSPVGAAPVPPTPEVLVRPIPPSPRLEAPPVPTQAVKSVYPDLIRLCLDVLATKVQTLIALVVASGIWGYVVVNPDPWRLGAAGLFSLSVFLPMVVIYWRSGTKGEGGLQ